MTAASAFSAAVAAALCAAAALGGRLLGPWLLRAEPRRAGARAPAGDLRWPYWLIAAAVGAASAPEIGPLQLVMLAVVIGLLAACAAADRQFGLIPDSCSLGAIALILTAALVTRDWAPAAGAALIGTAFGAAALVTRGRGMGWGDVKLAAAGGALLGAIDATFAFALAAIVAYAVALRARRLKRPLAFGPYLAAATAIALIVQRPV